MKIVLVWYWKMWKIIHTEAENRWHDVVASVDPYNGTVKSLDDLSWIDFDVIIDFSIPKAAMQNMKYYADNNLKAVVWTTGWYDNIEEVKKYFSDSSWALLWASNFSIWVNLFWEVLKQASKIMNKVEDYDAFWHEFHHGEKIDSPSGTAITTAECVIDNLDRKDKLVTERLDRKPEKNELHFSSTRWWSVPWTHSIYFDSPFDTIEIKHTARSRNGFALWSVLAAEWLSDKNWYYEVESWIGDLIK